MPLAFERVAVVEAVFVLKIIKFPAVPLAEKVPLKVCVVFIVQMIVFAALLTVKLLLKVLAPDIVVVANPVDTF